MYNRAMLSSPYQLEYKEPSIHQRFDQLGQPPPKLSFHSSDNVSLDTGPRRSWRQIHGSHHVVSKLLRFRRSLEHVLLERCDLIVQLLGVRPLLL